jgi:FkbM family methyltransferase
VRVPIVERVGPPIVRAAIRHLPPRRRGIRLANGLRRRLELTDPVRLSREPSGMRLRCDLRDKLSFDIYFRGWVDEAVETWMRRWLRPGDHYIDVGAHIGYLVSLAAECVGPEGRIDAFEPNPDTFAKLDAAVRDAGDRAAAITVRKAAVGAEEGEATLHVPAGTDAHQSSEASLAPGEGFSATTQVPVIRLDDLPLDGEVRLLKIDTEGYELSVLQGARGLLDRCEAVLIELNPEALARGGSSEAQIVQTLEEHGFEPHTPTADGHLRGRAAMTVAGRFEDVAFVRP